MSKYCDLRCVAGIFDFFLLRKIVRNGGMGRQVSRLAAFG